MKPERKRSPGLVIRWACGTILIFVLLSFPRAVMSGPERDEPVAEGRPDTGLSPGESSEGSGNPPAAWIREMIDNAELLESLDMMEKIELFVEPDLFSPHDF